MSIQLLSQAWRLHMPSTRKLVLMKLADCANDAGEVAYSSVPRLASECGISEGAALTSVKALVRDGLLSEADGGRGCDLAFVLDMARLAEGDAKA